VKVTNTEIEKEPNVVWSGWKIRLKTRFLDFLNKSKMPQKSRSPNVRFFRFLFL